MDERPGEVPNDLKAFLYTCIDAVEQVEILVRLMRDQASWTVKAISREVGVPDAVARHHLETLTARGLVQATLDREMTYIYGPKSTELRRFAESLAAFYAGNRTAVLRFIAAGPRRLKPFSDAFKLRDPE